MAAYMKVAIMVACLVAAVSALEDHHEHHDIEYYHKHSEHRDGDKTEGEYVVNDPDGTIRTVKYYVHGKSGFVATVHRSGHAVHPKTVHHFDHH
ncbi:hypothetical protein B566_EDAN009074 [Ephemera danica]|nr:hypothetical protein B566_EDAN009074 [Ephemera danica]